MSEILPNPHQRDRIFVTLELAAFARRLVARIEDAATRKLARRMFDATIKESRHLIGGGE